MLSLNVVTFHFGTILGINYTIVLLTHSCSYLLIECRVRDPAERTVLKIGHGGTLDAQATGLMAIGLGEGCGLLTRCLKSDKVFVFFLSKKSS